MQYLLGFVQLLMFNVVKTFLSMCGLSQALHISRVLCLLTAMLFSQIALAQINMAETVSTSRVGSNVASRAEGRLALNMTSGIGNTQWNGAAIANSTLTNVTISSTSLGQNALTEVRNIGTASASIAKDAFRYAAGAISVNQSSGVFNSQANVSVVTQSALSEDDLHVHAVRDPASTNFKHSVLGSREVGMENGAFQNASGIIQLNQAAGAGNSAVNSFAFTMNPSIK